MFSVLYPIKKYFDKWLMPKQQRPLLGKHLMAMENRFHGAIQFLRKNTLFPNKRKTNLEKLPWYLLIGLPSAGKTTLLGNSNIKFILDKKIKTENLYYLPKSETCDWWITSKAVIVDIPGSYVLKNQKMSMANQCWHHFLSCIVNLHSEKNLAGTLLTISLSQLVDVAEYKKVCEFLEIRIGELRRKFGQRHPFNIVITKCDLLPGFLEFFGDYSLEDRSQIWGVPLSLRTNENLLEVFIKRFDHLIKVLQGHVLANLHQERFHNTRFSIKDFPLHVEHLKQLLVKLIKTLDNKAQQFNVNGIFLTSGIQYPANQSNQEVMVLTKNSVTTNLLRPPSQLKPQAFFVKNMLLHGLTPVRLSKDKPTKLHRTGMMTMLFLFYGLLGLSQMGVDKTTFEVTAPMMGFGKLPIVQSVLSLRNVANLPCI